MRTIHYLGCDYVVCSTGVVTEEYQRKAEREWGRPIALTEPQEDQVQACMAWLQQYATPRKTVNERIGSYGLKHVVERQAPGGYVTNGALIEAVCRLGWEVIPDGPRSPNACFRLSYDKEELRAGLLGGAT